MKKIDLVFYVGGAYAYAPARLVEETRKKNLTYKIIQYKDLTFQIKKNKIEDFVGGGKIPRARGAFLRALGEVASYNALKYYIIDISDRYKTKILNRDSFLKWPSLDKTTQYLELVKAKLPIVESAFFGSKSKLVSWAKKNKFPLIVKDSDGSCGTGVFKIDDIKELNNLLKLYNIFTVKTLLVQRFLKGGEDLRVIVLNGKVLGAMKRISKEGDFLTNYSRGGSAVSYDVFKDYKACEIALGVAKHFDLDYCGVDLMRNEKGDWIVLEVNRACQFKGFEEATKINIASKVIDYLLI